MSNSVITLTETDQLQYQQAYSMNMDTLYEELSHSQDPLRIEQLSSIIFSEMIKLQSIDFETSLHFLVKIFNKGYSKFVTESPELVKKIMRSYVSISNQFKRQQTSSLYYRSLFVLSIIAELIRQQNKYQFPFTHEFLRSIFALEIQSMTIQQQRNKLLAIVTAIYSNLSRQTALIKELKISKTFKQILLQNYSLAVQPPTIKLMNQTILFLQTKAVVLFTFSDLEKYGIKKFLLKTLSTQKGETMIKYLQKLFPRVKNMN